MRLRAHWQHGPETITLCTLHVLECMGTNRASLRKCRQRCARSLFAFCSAVTPESQIPIWLMRLHRNKASHSARKILHLVSSFCFFHYGPLYECSMPRMRQFAFG